jgi:hypothetical protein
MELDLPLVPGAALEPELPPPPLESRDNVCWSSCAD